MSKTIKGRLKNLDKYIQRKWDEHYWDFVCKYSDILNWEYISYNPNITMGMIEQYPDKEWDWERISQNPNLTIEFVDKYPDKPWDWYNISQNPNITWDIIEA